MPQDHSLQARNSRRFIASISLAVGGVVLATAGILGAGATGARAGDPEPIPEPSGTVPVSTEVPTQPPPTSTQPPPTSTTVPPTPVTVITQTSVPTTVPTQPPASTSVPTATATPVPPTAEPTQVQAVAGVRQLPVTGAGEGARTSWALVIAGAAMSFAGLASLGLRRR